jgi:hypothetical protein
METIIAAEYGAGGKEKRFCARYDLRWWMAATVVRHETMHINALVVFFSDYWSFRR